MHVFELWDHPEETHGEHGNPKTKKGPQSEPGTFLGTWHVGGVVDKTSKEQVGYAWVEVAEVRHSQK